MVEIKQNQKFILMEEQVTGGLVYFHSLIKVSTIYDELYIRKIWRHLLHQL